jgi:opacity protein-like surface antigen
MIKKAFFGTIITAVMVIATTTVFAQEMPEEPLFGGLSFSGTGWNREAVTNLAATSDDLKERDADRYIRGDNEERFTSIGANLALGFGSKDEKEGHLAFNGAININATLPLFWLLFAEIGIDIGLSGGLYLDDDGDGKAGEHEVASPSYSAFRPYGRLNIGAPVGDFDFLVPYAGFGVGYMSATYKYESKLDPNRASREKTFESFGIDLVLGVYLGFDPHYFHAGLNFTDIFSDLYSNLQLSLGYTFRF